MVVPAPRKRLPGAWREPLLAARPQAPLDPKPQALKPGMPLAPAGCMTMARQQLGRFGEDLACAELERRGYQLLARGYRSRFGELDIVADDRGTLVFVEVKARDGRRFGDPAEAVTPRKQRRVVAMAEDFVARRGLQHRPCRFDVVAIDTSSTPPKVVVYQDAFRPGW